MKETKTCNNCGFTNIRWHMYECRCGDWLCGNCNSMGFQYRTRYPGWCYNRVTHQHKCFEYNLWMLSKEIERIMI